MTRRKLDDWYNETIQYQTKTGVDQNTDPTWGAKDTTGARIERNVMRKREWQREVTDRYTKFSVGEEWATNTTLRIWLPEDDFSDDGQARIPDIVRPVYDKWGRFVHTVVEL